MIADKVIYGQAGTYFSLIYFAISLVSSGFEESLSFSYAVIKSSKEKFKSLLFFPILTQLWTALGILIISIIGLKWFNSPLLSINNITAVCIGGIILSEIMRKSLRRFLHLSFCNRTTAASEISLICVYVSLVWGMFYATTSLSLFKLIFPMLIASCVATGILIGKTIRLYRRLPDILSDAQSTPLVRSHRIYNYLSQFIHQIFSGNMLIPLVASYYGFNKAAVMELVRNIIYLVSIILNKIVGPTGEAMLAHMRKENNKSIRTIYNAAHKMGAAIIWIGIVLCVAIFYHKNDFLNLELSLAVFALYLLEHVSIFYERLLRVQGHAQRIFTFNAITLLAALLISPFAYTAEPYRAIGALAAIKALHVLLLRRYGYRIHSRTAPLEIG
ncbi:hypothetical protein Noda2021_05250 [Candidatus Dependentiae bacterium Noda2021]|nr:hypothetical protein Noda2021_05250 [Candidatus Dependentiae bacterium Noda2021]